MRNTIFKNEDQCNKFLDAAKRIGVYEMIYIELITGLRQGELLGLKWEDIDLRKGLIHVNRQIDLTNGQIVETPLKTNSSYRTFIVSPQVVAVLKQQKARIKNQKEMFVFQDPNGGPISPDSMDDMLNQVYEQVGLPKAKFRALRHAFVSRELQNGMDDRTVRGMLGLLSKGSAGKTYDLTTVAQNEVMQTMACILD